jgi:hypothetical protein
MSWWIFLLVEELEENQRPAETHIIVLSIRPSHGHEFDLFAVHTNFWRLYYGECQASREKVYIFCVIISSYNFRV